jgi:hypothetical protein
MREGAGGGEGECDEKEVEQAEYKTENGMEQEEDETENGMEKEMEQGEEEEKEMIGWKVKKNTNKYVLFPSGLLFDLRLCGGTL